MKFIRIAAVTGGLLFAAMGACTAQPATPTTKILAIGTPPAGADLKLAQSILPTEVRATVQLYLDGKIDQWYSLENRVGVVFVVNASDVETARTMLEALPLGQAHLMTFELIPIGPLNPLRMLMAPAKQ